MGNWIISSSHEGTCWERVGGEVVGVVRSEGGRGGGRGRHERGKREGKRKKGLIDREFESEAKGNYTNQSEVQGRN